MKQTIIFMLLLIGFTACKNHKAGETQTEQTALPPVADEGETSLIQDKIYATEKSINEFAATRKDPSQIANLKRKTEDIKAETAEAIQYLDKWKVRLVAAAGGQQDDGTLKKGNDTAIVTKLMVKEKSADTLRWHVEEVREIFLRQVHDTDELISFFPTAIESSNNAGWNTALFSQAPVYAGYTMLEKLKKDVYTSELLALNKILKEAKPKEAKR